MIEATMHFRNKEQYPPRLTTGGSITVTRILPVAVQLNLLVWVRLTVRVPVMEYVWDIGMPVPVVPSPKPQL